MSKKFPKILSPSPTPPPPSRKYNLTPDQQSEFKSIFIDAVTDLLKHLKKPMRSYSDLEKLYYDHITYPDIPYHNIIHTYQVVKRYKALEFQKTGKNTFNILSAYYHDYHYYVGDSDYNNIGQAKYFFTGFLKNDLHLSFTPEIDLMVADIENTNYTNLLFKPILSILQIADLYDLIYGDNKTLEKNFDLLREESNTFMTNFEFYNKQFMFLSNLKSYIERGHFLDSLEPSDIDQFYDNIEYCMNLCEEDIIL